MWYPPGVWLLHHHFTFILSLARIIFTYNLLYKFYDTYFSDKIREKRAFYSIITPGKHLNI